MADNGEFHTMEMTDSGGERQLGIIYNRKCKTMENTR